MNKKDNELTEFQSKWDKINETLKELSENQYTLHMWDKEYDEIHWKIMELMDDKQKLYNKLIEDGFIPLSVGAYGKWVRK